MANELAVREKDVAESVLQRVKNLESCGGIKLPPNYSAENALKSAWLILQEAKTKDNKPVLEHCTKPSIANALFGMVTQGLNPVKNQCYFIPYGAQLQLSRSYMGTIAVGKRVAGIKDQRANVIYDKDEFAYEIDAVSGDKKICKHMQSLSNLGGNIIGAYAILTLADDSRYVEIMSMEQIMKAWGRGQTKGGSPAHKDHPEEMAKKTVLNRAVKLFINTSDDAALYEGYDELDSRDYAKESAVAEIGDNANKGEIIGFIDETDDNPASEAAAADYENDYAAEEMAGAAAGAVQENRDDY